MRNLWQIALGVVLAVAWLPAATLLSAEEKKPQAVDEIEYKPIELFTGDTARIAPHLDLTGYGAVNISIPGNDKVVGYGLEVWKNGKPEKVQYGTHWPAESHEVTFTVREAKNDDGKKIYKFIIHSPGATRTIPLVYPTLQPGPFATDSQTLNLCEKLKAKDGTTVSVWVMTKGNIDQTLPSVTMEDLARRAEWAVILKVGVANRDPKRVNPFEK